MIANITFYIIIFWYLPPYNNFIKTRRMLPGIIRKASPAANKDGLMAGHPGQRQSKSQYVVGDADSDVWVKLRSWCRCHSEDRP